MRAVAVAVALAVVLLGAAPAHEQPDEGLPLPESSPRTFDRLSVTVSDYLYKSSTIVVTGRGAVTVDGRAGKLTPAEQARLQAAFEAYDDSYGLTSGTNRERSVKLTQPEEDWYVPPIDLVLDVGTSAGRHRATFTLPQLDRLDGKRVEHALVRALLDVRSRLLLGGASTTLTVSRPGALSTTRSAEVAQITSDGVFAVETRTTRTRRGKVENRVHRTSQRLASAAELEALRKAAASAGGAAAGEKAVIRLADGSLRAAGDVVGAMLELERHGGPRPGASSGLASTLERSAEEVPSR